MRYEIKPIAVAAKPIGISERPADGAPHLLGQRKQAAAGVIHSDEIEHHEVGAGVRERLGEKAVVGCGAGTRRAAMDKDRNRARWLRAPACGCGIDVEAFDRRRSIGEAFGLADPRPHCRAVGDPAPRPADRRRRRARSGPYRARPAGPWTLLPQHWLGSSCLSFVSKPKHHLLLRKTCDREPAKWLQAVVPAMVDEILRSKNRAAEAAGEFLKPRRQVYRGPDTSEIEAIAAADIAEQHVADMER